MSKIIKRCLQELQKKQKSNLLPSQVMPILNAGFRFAHDGPGVSAPPPLPGEHTEEILAGLDLSSS